MAYHVVTGEIIAGVLYSVAGGQSVIYNGGTYNTGQQFRGLAGVNAFTYTGTGTQEVNEVTEFTGMMIEYVDLVVYDTQFSDTTVIKGFGLEYELNESEKIVTETTRIQGFGLELIDFPFFSFAITEHRYFAN